MHSGTYVLTFVLLGTGLWLLAGHEGQPSFLARLVNRPDVEIHRRVGWAFVALFGIALTLRVRAAASFVRESVRVNRGDGAWFRRWPVGALTGRFAPHRGHFDPGQRIANLAFIVTFGVLIASGIGLTTVHGGPQFVFFDRLHRWATYALMVVVAAHIAIAVGILPGYRGAWRAMHLRGRTPVRTVRRLWPASIKADLDAPILSASADAQDDRATRARPTCRDPVSR